MTTTEQLKRQLTEKPKVANTFPAMLEAFLPEIKKALPRHLSADRMARIALTAFRMNPALGRCDPRSVFASVIQASQMGLEIGLMGHAYLVPYKDQCQFIPGWKGLVDLVNRAGQATVFTGVIFKDQKYAFKDGSSRELVIENETNLDDPEDITHAYAVGWVKGATMPIIELWRVEKIRKHRDRYNKVGKRHYSYENWEMYARKIPLLQVIKYMPVSSELAAAMALDAAAERGNQNLGINDAIEGSWVPEPVEPQSPAEMAGAAPHPSPVEAFKMADALCQDGDFDAASDLLQYMAPADAEIIRQQIPKG
jgi:recombination protein RecT